MNILNTIQSALNTDVIAKMAGLAGITADQARGAVGTAVPALLAGLSDVASTPQGASQLAAAVDRADDSWLTNPGSMLAGGGSVIDKGVGMLGSLLGQGQLSNLVAAFSRFTGLGEGSVKSLLGMLVPVVLGALAKFKRQGGLDAGGLANLLSSQKSSFVNALPAGLGNLFSGGASVAQRAAAYSEPVRRGAAQPSGASVMRWLLPLLLIAGLAAIIWAFTRSRQETVATVPPAATPAPSVTPAPEFESRGAPAEGVSARTVEPIAGDVSALTQQATTQIRDVFTKATDTLSKVTDRASAEAALPALRDLGQNVDGLAGLVNRIPAAARGPVNALVGEWMPKLQSTVDTVMQIPGVGDVLKPIVEPILGKLRALASAN